jgi:cobalt-precorrin 5A hydrolase
VSKSSVAIYALTSAGAKLAGKLSKSIGADLFLPKRLSYDYPDSAAFERLAEVISLNFNNYQGHVIIAATGLVVRLIAPLLKDKTVDPAVVCLGQDGRFVISLLSGHLGGANDLARTIATLTMGQAVINTATDLSGVPALEMLARDLALKAESLAPLAAVSRVLCEGGKILVKDDYNFLWPHLAPWPDSFERLDLGRPLPDDNSPKVLVDFRISEQTPEVLVLRPPALAMGVGCHRDALSSELIELSQKTLKDHNLAPLSVRVVATIDRRTDPKFAPSALAETLGCPLISFSSDKLSSVIVPTPSEMVKKNIGVSSVCEAAAILAARKGSLLVPKVKSARATCALAQINWI